MHWVLLVLDGAVPVLARRDPHLDEARTIVNIGDDRQRRSGHVHAKGASRLTKALALSSPPMASPRTACAET